MNLNSGHLLRLILPFALMLVATPLLHAQTAPSQKSAAQAIELFQANKFVAAADAFEPVVNSGNVRILYFAALANQQCGRAARSKQLFQYIVTNFPGSTEAKYSQTALARIPGDKAAASKPDEIDAVSENAKSFLSKEMQAVLNTPEGKAALRQTTAAALQNIKAPVLTVPTVRTAPVVSSAAGSAAKSGAFAAAKVAPASSHVVSDHPFTAADIAHDGSAGIDQSRYPNCWFEASLSALAALPRGQRLIANMIRQVPGDKFIVRFPNDGNEYIVTKEDMANDGLNDNAQWAAIIECAEIRKYPENQGTEGLNRLEVGLSCISGLKAEVLDPSHCGESELSSFIGGPIRSQNPIVCATGYVNGLPEIVFGAHAYTIIDFDPSRNLITLRNPHGRRSRSFSSLPDDPGQIHFQQLSNGVCKMDIVTFQKYFRSIARSFI